MFFGFCGKHVFAILTGKHFFCDFGMKTCFSVFAGKHVFAILTEKYFFAILAGKCVLGFWREKVVFSTRKSVFIVLSVFVCDKNDIMFRFVICELH